MRIFPSCGLSNSQDFENILGETYGSESSFKRDTKWNWSNERPEETRLKDKIITFGTNSIGQENMKTTDAYRTDRDPQFRKKEKTDPLKAIALACR